jgi:WD40 repeat protein
MDLQSILEEMMEQPVQYEAFLKLETGAHSARINQILVTPDGRKLITSGRDKTIRIWDVQSRKADGMLLGQIGPGSDGKIQAIAISPDGKFVVALAWRTATGFKGDPARETEVRVYQLATGNLQASFLYPGTFYDVDFSPDGMYLAVTGNPKRPVRQGYVYVYDSKEILKGFGKMPSHLKRHVVYDTDAVLPSYVRFIPTIPEKPAPYRMVVATWIQPKRGRGTGYDGQAYAGKILWYSYSPSKGLKELQSAPTAKSIHPDSLAVNNEYVVITGDHEKLEEFYCYNHDGQLVAAIPTDTRPARPAFSRNGSRLIVGQQDDSPLVQVEVYNTSTKPFQLRSVYYGHDADTVAVALLDNGIAVSAGGDRNAIHFWNPAHLEGEQIAVIRGSGRTVHAVGVMEDEDNHVHIGIGNHDDMRLGDGRIILQRIFDLHKLEMRPLSLFDSTSFKRSQRILGAHKLKLMKKDDQKNLYLLDEEKQLTGERGSIFPWYEPTMYGFTGKGTVITGDGDGNVRIEALGFNIPYERNLVGHTARVLDLAAGNKWLATAGADQVIRLWYLEDVEKPSAQGRGKHAPPLEPALNLFVGMDDEWVIWSKSGYFCASKRGDNRFGYHVNRGRERESLFFPGNRFTRSFLRPDIIQAIVECGSEERAIQALHESGVKVGRMDVSTILPPILEMEEDGILEAQDHSSVTLKFTVESLNRHTPVTRVWLVQNDTYLHVIPDSDWKRTRSGSMKYRIEASLTLQPGLNSIKILAQNQETSSVPFALEIEGPLGAKGKLPDNGTLYLLSVGVAELAPSTNKGGYKPLRFADEDAISIYNAFARSRFSDRPEHKGKNRAFKSVKARLLLNNAATKKGILDAIESLKDQIEASSQKSVPGSMQRDVLFIFLSGHGLRTSDASELFFWNYDLDFNDIGSTGLSFIELGKKITEFPAGEIILATDACKSGTAVKNVGEIDPNELAKQIYSINERGMYILSAARSGEAAWEDADVGHGFFTRSILDRLRKLRAGESVNMLGLIDSIQSGVQEYMQRYKQGNYQTPVCRVYGDLLPLTIYKKGGSGGK